MRLELTEILACPNCGPDRGFVVFVDTLEQGAVVQGRLDCPECERRHRMVDGVLHLAEIVPGGAQPRTPELPEAHELMMALLGVPAGPEVLLLGWGLEQLAGRLAVDRPTSSLLCLATERPAPAERVHPIIHGDTGALPFRSGHINGVVMAGATNIDPAEIVRVLVPGSRIVILEPGSLLAGFQALGGVSTLAADSRAAVLVASPLSAV